LGSWDSPFLIDVRTRLFEFLLLAWLFAVGGSIGSFVNVVVYRLPRGRSLLGASHCPYCCEPIHPADNVPVFGWLRLRGRSRCCHLPISARYPLVELAVASLFVLRGKLERLGAGINLPLEGRVPVVGSELGWFIRQPRWDLIATFAHHATLLCLLLTWGLIAEDGFRIPRVLLAVGLLLGFVAPAIEPAVQPMTWADTTADWLRLPGEWSRLQTALAGAAAGAVLGLGLSIAEHRRVRGRNGWTPGTILVGIFLGWQTAISVATVAVLGRALLRYLKSPLRRPVQPTGLLSLFGVAVLQIAAWRWSAAWSWWPSQEAVWAVPIAWTATALAAAAASDALESQVGQ
jgi:leader peptidase (prepilin peptidase)/N-methyltransferase